ncbi:CHAT domain-containing protein [Anabaena azotica]|uniref:CHAT domain-containing protein n=1 Tax=Anabaena azotica FACHB-119 TaxID=947527 RepID=A0ABR8DA67_9NOST|nr:CHAT domain-containing tetratricopeptide repeat protein [Anabaena azotica]MBD2504085.1 CHAT domain-containing protein [Anabaena azotica FACHB-119]
MFKLIQKTISFVASTAIILTASSLTFAQEPNTISTPLHETTKKVNSVDSPDYDNSINRIEKLLTYLHSTPEERVSDLFNTWSQNYNSNDSLDAARKNLLEGEKILEMLTNLETSQGESLVIADQYQNSPVFDYSRDKKCIPASKNVENKAAMSCKELVYATLCKLASDAGEQNKTISYCEQYFKEFNKNLSTYSKNQRNLGFAISLRCSFVYDIKFIDKSSTLKYCFDSIKYSFTLKSNFDPSSWKFSYSIADRHLITANSVINSIYREQGKYNEAINFLQEQLQGIQINDLTKIVDPISQSSEIPAAVGVRLALLELLGDTYMEMGLFDKAIEAYQKNKNEGLEERDFGSGKDSVYSTELNIGEDGGQFVRLLTKLGYALLRKGNLTDAEKELLAALHWLDNGAGMLDSGQSGETVKLIAQDRNSSVYSTLQKLYIEQRKYPQALEFAERARSSVFTEQVSRFSREETQKEFQPFSFAQIQAEAKAQNSTFVMYSRFEPPVAILNKSKQVSEELFIWVVKPNGELHFNNVDVASTSLNLTSQSFQNQSPNNQFWFGIIATIILSGLCLSFLKSQKQLKREYITVSVVAVLLQLALVGCRQASLEAQKQNNNSTVLDLVRGTYTSLIKSNSPINNSSCTSQKACLEQLYQTLIQPIEQYLPDNPEAHVIFFPYRELYTIPFAALKAKDGKYLIEKNTIHIAPSIEALNLLKVRAEKNPFLPSRNLVVGNPVMPKLTLSGLLSESITPESLPATATEAQTIANFFNTSPLIGEQATESTVLKQLSNAKYIHLATHGFLDVIAKDGFEPTSVLTLTPSRDNDGLLTTEELYEIPLVGELAVLSACNTGAGEITSEGVLGLARPFLIAGIPSVVASLWSVPDNPTKDLMIQFYENLKGNPDKARALRQAMIATMKEHPDPVAWAGFTLIGLAQQPPSALKSSQKTQIVGQVSCSGIIADPLSSGRAIKKATLESTAQGFNLRIVELGTEHLLELDNNLVVQAASTDGGSWNLVAYNASKEPVKINQDGSFSIGMMVSTRSVCNFSGKLEFLGDTKSKLFGN